MIRVLNLLRRQWSGRVSSREGFSLVDVMIAMVILLIAIASSTALAVQLARTTQVDNRITAAANLADYKLEELRNLDYDNVVSDSDDSTLDSLGNSPGKFTRAWVVTADSPAVGLKTVTVSITWNQWDGNQTYEMTGVIGQ